jgi:hypothetical protein
MATHEQLHSIEVPSDIRTNAMRVNFAFAQEQLEFDIAAEQLVQPKRQTPTPARADWQSMLVQALEQPVGFPALRLALTPNDHLALVADHRLPHFVELLASVLAYLGQNMANLAVTLVLPPEAPAELLCEIQQSVSGLPMEIHEPGHRERLSYLATTAHGRRIYLNRTTVDADQVIVLAACRFDPVLGYSGSEGALYPTLADEAARQHAWEYLSVAMPGEKRSPLKKEAAEVCWLLGAPFMIQVIEGEAEELAHIVAGPMASDGEAERLLNARWRLEIDEAVDTVVAGVGGNPLRHDFADLARALDCAARVVKPGGSIILLTRAKPELGRGLELLRQAEEPAAGLALLKKERPPDIPAAYQWARAVQRASVYLFSELPADTAEEIFTTPLDNPKQINRLLARSGSALFLADAHKTLAVLASNGSKK